MDGSLIEAADVLRRLVRALQWQKEGDGLQLNRGVQKALADGQAWDTARNSTSSPVEVPVAVPEPVMMPVLGDPSLGSVMPAPERVRKGPYRPTLQPDRCIPEHGACNRPAGHDGPHDIIPGFGDLKGWTIEDCRKRGNQACHICPDHECCDNTNEDPAVKAKVWERRYREEQTWRGNATAANEALAKRLELSRQAVRELREEHKACDAGRVETINVIGRERDRFRRKVTVLEEHLASSRVMVKKRETERNKARNERDALGVDLRECEEEVDFRAERRGERNAEQHAALRGAYDEQTDELVKSMAARDAARRQAVANNDAWKTAHAEMESLERRLATAMENNAKLSEPKSVMLELRRQMREMRKVHLEEIEPLRVMAERLGADVDRLTEALRDIQWDRVPHDSEGFDSHEERIRQRAHEALGGP